jgi:hypothetical protein
VSRWLILAVAGAVLCTLGDYLHASHGVLTYPQIAFGVQDWWVPPLFAAASLVCVLLARPFIEWGRRAGAVRTPDARQIVADGIGFFAAYAYTSFAAHDRPSVTLTVLSVAFLVRVLAERRPTWLVVYCLLLGVGGVVTECLVSSTGRFHYLHPDLLKTPRWLAGIYLHAGLLAGELGIVFGPARVQTERTPSHA